MEFLGGLIPVLVLAGIFGLIIPLTIHHNKATNAAWSEAARTLQLNHTPMGFFQGTMIRGSHHGFSVKVTTYKRGKNSSGTRYELLFPQPLGLGLTLTREGFLSGIGKLLGMQDHQIGDARFDAEIVIKGRDPRRVRAFLTPARRLRIHRFLTVHSEATINDQGITVTHQSVNRDARVIVARVSDMVRLAWHLTGERQADQTLERAMHAQDAGRPEEALWILDEQLQQSTSPQAASVRHSATPNSALRTPHSEDDFAPQPVEERLLEGQILLLGGRREDAKAAFAEAARQAPQDVELTEWADEADRRAQPTPVAADERQYPLDVQSVCETLFDTDHSSFVAARLFEERYAGRPVRWAGTIERVERFGYDFVFGSTPGTKAVVRIYELATEFYGEKRIHAIARFPEDAAEALNSLVGRPLTFEGTLLKVDGFMRNIYVADAELVGDDRDRE